MDVPCFNKRSSPINNQPEDDWYDEKQSAFRGKTAAPFSLENVKQPIHDKEWCRDDGDQHQCNKCGIENRYHDLTRKR